MIVVYIIKANKKMFFQKYFSKLSLFKKSTTKYTPLDEDYSELLKELIKLDRPLYEIANAIEKPEAITQVYINIYKNKGK